MKLLIVGTLLSLACQGFASQINAKDIVLKVIEPSIKALALDWKVGDKAQYNIDMGIARGTNDVLIREKNERGFWVEQNMELGSFGAQKAEILFDKNNGQILEILVNGEPQDIPDGGNQEVIEVREDNITVPAGNFDCMYLKVRDTETNKVSEAWINPQVVPVSGALKQLSPGPMGLTVKMELVSFEKN